MGLGNAVGIVGVGGMGFGFLLPFVAWSRHFGLLWPEHSGAQRSLRSLVIQGKWTTPGASVFIATKEDARWADKHANSIDVIICTTYAPQLPIEEFFGVLMPHATLVRVGAPECGFPVFNFFPMLCKGLKISGSLIGSPAEIEEMLHLALEKLG